MNRILILQKSRIFIVFIIFTNICFAVERDQNNFENNSDFFPIAVWMQNPEKAEQYKNIGINTYVGLWQGPTDEQIKKLKKSEMNIVCKLNTTAEKYLNEEKILAWMQEDEPDMVRKTKGKLWNDSPIPASEIIEEYGRIKKIDPKRPVFMNFSPAVAVDEWNGRGKRTNHPEDYLEYLKGCDIASFDIYPVTDRKSYINGKLYLVGKGVTRLKQWGNNEKTIWNCIETTRIDNPNVKPSPAQVKAEVWISIISGSRGIIYFVHQFRPKFLEAGLLADPEMCNEIKQINSQIKKFASIINSPNENNLVEIKTLKPNSLAVMVKKFNKKTYIFAIPLIGEKFNAEFKLKNINRELKIFEINSNKEKMIHQSGFTDSFIAYSFHIYEISN